MNKTKISIIGLGKMGQLMYDLLQENPKAEVVSTISPSNPKADFKKISLENLNNAEVAIVFTTPESAIENLKQIINANSNIKIIFGTTGWLDKITEVETLLKANPEAAILYASNFSIGVHLFWKTVNFAAQQFNKHNQIYDTFGHEFHHNQKADSPGGTAKTTAEILLKNFDTKSEIIYQTAEQKIKPNQLHYSSTRGGNIPGTHSVYFDSVEDNIEITHTARNRNGFANGAIQTALWITNKKGLFTIEDYINQLTI
jgi:4-hydroxy-tetrahydrodipicolinate reductase